MSDWEKDDILGTENFDSVDIEQPPCWLVLRSKRPVGVWENFVSNATGGHIHTDIVLHKDGSESKRFKYTAYMKTPFSMYIMSEDEKTSELYDNLQIRITDEEYHACVQYLDRWVESATPYNYSDTLFLIPSLANTGAFGNAMVHDVDGSLPTNLRTVFCSQAAVLVLRHCLSATGNNQHLVKAMWELNSRLTTPELLYETTLVYAKSISNEKLWA